MTKCSCLVEKALSFSVFFPKNYFSFYLFFLKLSWELAKLFINSVQVLLIIQLSTTLNKGPESSLLIALVSAKHRCQIVFQFFIEIVQCIGQILPRGFWFSWEIFHDPFFYINSLLIIRFYFSTQRTPM